MKSYSYHRNKRYFFAHKKLLTPFEGQEETQREKFRTNNSFIFIKEEEKTKQNFINNIYS